MYSYGTFFRFVYHLPRKIWQPWKEPGKAQNEGMNDSALFRPKGGKPAIPHLTETE
jgi:hypothetical protein